MPKNIKWKTVETKIKDEKENKLVVKKILSEFNEFILNSIKEKYKLLQSQVATPDESHSE